MLRVLYLLAILSIVKQACPARTRTELRIGVLFDVRSLHLRPLLEATLSQLTREGEEVGRGMVLIPVIATVDITDSFAISNAMCDLITKDVVAIVGVTNVSSLATIQSYSNTFQVPFITIGASQNYTTPSLYQLFVRPAFMAAIVDLLQHFNCKKVVYIYDGDEGLMRIQDLFQSLNSREVLLDLDVRRVTSGTSVTDVIKYLTNDDHKIGLVFAIMDLEHHDMSNTIQALNSERDVHSPDLTIVAITLDIVNLSTASINHSRINISGFQLLQDASSGTNERLDTYGTDIHTSSEALLVDALRVIKHAADWALAHDADTFQSPSNVQSQTSRDKVKCTNFVVDKNSNGPLLMEFLRQVRLEGLTGNIAFDRGGRRADYRLFMYESKAGNQPIEVGIWHPDQGLTITSENQAEKTVILLVNDTRVITVVDTIS